MSGYRQACRDVCVWGGGGGKQTANALPTLWGAVSCAVTLIASGAFLSTCWQIGKRASVCLSSLGVCQPICTAGAHCFWSCVPQCCCQQGKEGRRHLQVCFWWEWGVGAFPWLGFGGNPDLSRRAKEEYKNLPLLLLLTSAGTAAAAAAVIRVARQGLWLVVQFSPLDAADEAHLSSQLSGALGATLGSYELIPGEFSDEEGPLDKKGEWRE